MVGVGPHDNQEIDSMPVMRTHKILVAAVLAGVIWGVHATRPDAQSVTTAFVGVTVIPMDTEAVLADQTVLVRDGRISSIAPAAKAQIPAGAIRVDGKGKFLMPGLAEMHAHIPGGQAPDSAVERTLFLYAAQRHHDDSRHARRSASPDVSRARGSR